MVHINTLLAHTAFVPDSDTAAVIPPVHFATTYERAQDNSYPSGYVYSREGNPTRRLLEKTLTGLETGFDCRAFSSGMAAGHAVLMALPAESHIIIPDDVYHGFRHLVMQEARVGRYTFSAVDMTDLTRISEAVTPNTRLIWVESPSNPQLKISDIAAISSIARQNEITLAVDGTWTSPILQRPFDLGADIVLHSVTKYIAGHSDVLGGALIFKDQSEYYERVCENQKLTGAVLDPFSSWLTLRGVRTLAVRLRTQCETASRVANFLNQHNRVSRVYFPGLESHPGFEIASRQMTSSGAMLSFETAGGEADSITVAASVKLFRRATSLGGTESLIEHRASMEGPGTTTPPGLLRLSIGLEYSDDLIADLEQALAEI